MDTKIYHVYTKIEIFTPDRSETMLEIFKFCKRRGWKCNCEKTDQQMQQIKTKVDKGWFSLAEFLSSLKINSYVSHFVPQKRRAGFQLKLKILSNRIQNYI